jgi:WD40 repeat protein
MTRSHGELINRWSKAAFGVACLAAACSKGALSTDGGAQDGASQSCSIPAIAGHARGVNAVAFSPDGSWLVSASADHTARVWRVADGTLVRTLTGHTQQLFAVAVSPDGALIATGSGDIDGNSPGGEIKLWASDDGTLLRTLPSQWAYSVAFSPDGRSLASGHITKDVKLWNVSDGELLRTMTGHGDYATGVAFTPDGATIASVSWDGTIKLWRASDGELLRTMNSGVTGAILGVGISPDGSMLVSAGAAPDQIEVWTLPAGDRRLQISSGGSFGAVFTTDGRSIVLANERTSVFSATDGTFVRGFDRSSWCVAASPDGVHLAIGDTSGAVRLLCLQP